MEHLAQQDRERTELQEQWDWDHHWECLMQEWRDRKREMGEKEQQERERRAGWEDRLLEWEHLWQGRLPRWSLNIEKWELKKQECERRTLWELEWEREKQEHAKRELERMKYWEQERLRPPGFLALAMCCLEYDQNCLFQSTSWLVESIQRMAFLDDQDWTRDPECPSLRKQLWQRLSSTFFAIERLSSWVPSTTNKAKLCRFLRTAKEQLDELRSDEKHHSYLRVFMARHHTLCAFVIDHSANITHQDSEKIAELFKELRQMTQKLRNHALKKATGYEKLFDDFIARREGLSDLLDLASAGQGRSLIDSFTSSLKDVAISARREADIWERQGNKFSDWTTIQETYSSASAKMPAFPPDPGEAPFKDSSHIETVPPDPPNPNVLVRTTQQVSMSFSHLNTYVVETQPKFIQKRLVKTSHSLAKGFTKTKAFLDLVKSTAGDKVSEVMGRLVTAVSDVSKVWRKIHFSVRCWSPIWVLFLKPACTLSPVDRRQSSLQEGNSSHHYDLLMASIDAASKRLHPLLIDSQACLLSMSNCLFSQADFWADTEKRLDGLLRDMQPIGIAL